MTDILNFPGCSERGGRQEFIQDGNETLQFGDGGITGFVAPAASDNTHVFSSHIRSRPRYWSNQELADLFRVKRLLDAAGIVCEVDHASTDEGDPWFVFCDEAGEVFIHLCRIGGEYLLDSHSLSSPLRGTDFNGLIEAFTQRHIPDEDRSGVSTGTDLKVVRFERNGNVFMHPATMLAALVWTLFLASEKLVMLLPETTEEHAGAVDGLAAGQVVAKGVSGVLSDETGGDASWGQDADDQPAAQFLRELAEHGDSKLNYNTYAVGLSAIAISAGFMSAASVTDIDPLGLSDILAALIGAEQTVAPSEQHKLLSDLDEDATDFLLFIEGIVEKLNLFNAQIRTAENRGDPAGDATDSNSQVIDVHLDHLLDGAGSEQTITLKAVAQDPDTATIDTRMANIDGDFLQALANDQENPNNADTVEVMLASLGLTEGDNSFLIDLQSMTVENMEIRATFVVTGDVLDKTSRLLANAATDPDLPLTDSQTIEFFTPDDGRPHYDEHAQAIVQFIMDNSEDLEIIATQDEVMFFDAAIIDADVDDIVVFSWSLSNGDIIAVMGLRSELDGVNLIM